LIGAGSVRIKRCSFEDQYGDAGEAIRKELAPPAAILNFATACCDGPVAEREQGITIDVA